MGASAQAGVAFFYAIPVGLGTYWLGWRTGAALAAACLALYLAGAAIHPVEHFAVALAIRAGALAAVVLGVALLRTRIHELERSAEELEAIRLALTPPSIPSLGVDVAAAFIPSELGVSGDFYLLTNGPEGSTIAVVGDVAGHGPRAAQLATFIRAQLATYAANSGDPAEILTLANSALYARRGRRAELVSAACLRLEPESGDLAWAVAGHPPPLRLPELDSLKIAGSTFPLGADAGLAPQTMEARLDRDAGVLVYTDGATDFRVEGGGMLGLDGLRRLLTPFADLPAERLAGEIEETLLDWAHGPIRDDICVLVLRPPAAGLTA